MKKTLSVNIGSIGFIIDEDAYETLQKYYKDISSRLYASERKEIMDDVESRTADIFQEQMTYTSQVVTLDMVKRAIAIIGPAQSFGEKRYDSNSDSKWSKIRKLYRSQTNVVIGGVCGGIAEYFNTDVSMIRLITLLLIVFGGLSIWVYIIMWIILPPEPIHISGGRNSERRNR